MAFLQISKKLLNHRTQNYLWSKCILWLRTQNRNGYYLIARGGDMGGVQNKRNKKSDPLRSL